MSEALLGGRIELHCGDCVVVMAELPENSIDAVVCDPPYHLTSIVKRFGGDNAAPAKAGKTGAYARASAGFMGRTWDAPDAPAIDPGFAHWFAGFVDGEGCFSVHKKSVNGCETYDCQFSITLRDDDKAILLDIQKHLGGIGTLADRPSPKVGNGKPQARYCISSQRDCQRLRAILQVFPLRAKKARDFWIWSEALDAWLAHEPKQSWGDVAYFRDALMAARKYGADFHPSQLWAYKWARQALRVLKPGGHLIAFSGTRTYHRMACAIEDAGFEIRDQIGWAYGTGFNKSGYIRGRDGEIVQNGWGGSLKPAWEPIALARKPLVGTVAENMARFGTGALNIDGCRIEAPDGVPKFTHRGEAAANCYGDGKNGSNRTGAIDTATGRWPANLCHDGSDEVLAAFPETSPATAGKPRAGVSGDGWGMTATGAEYNDAGGSAARFFYTSKADAGDRVGSKHPTVKPVDLMQWLVRLVTPPKGTILDPFAGTGTTGEAAYREGFNAVLIEREAEYQTDIRRRMALVLAGPEERSRESIKARGLTQDAGPLFGDHSAEVA